MAAITDVKYGEARQVIGKIEGSLELTGKEYKLDFTPMLKNLKVVEDALRDFAREAADLKEKLAQAQADIEATRGKTTSGAGVLVTLEGSPEAIDITNVFVAQNDNPHQWAGSVYQQNGEGDGPVLETPPFRVPLTFREIDASGEGDAMSKTTKPLVQKKAAIKAIRRQVGDNLRRADK